MNNNQMETRNQQIAKYIHRTKRILGIFVLAIIVYLIIASFPVLSYAASNEDVLSEYELGIFVASVMVSLPALIVCSYVGQRLDMTYGGYYCKQCNHIHFPTEKDVEHLPFLLNYNYRACPVCKKKSWLKKVVCVHKTADQPLAQ